MTDAVFSRDELDFLRGFQTSTEKPAAAAKPAKTSGPAKPPTASVAEVPTPEAQPVDMTRMAEETGKAAQQVREAAPSALPSNVIDYLPLLAPLAGYLGYKMGQKTTKEPGKDIGSRTIQPSRVEPTMEPSGALFPTREPALSVEQAVEQANKAATEAAIPTLAKTKKEGGAISPQDVKILEKQAEQSAAKQIQSAGIKPPEKTPVDVSGLTKEQASMKRYLVAQYGGGKEGIAAYDQVTKILGEVPSFPKGQGGGLSPEQTSTIKGWRKENIPGPKINLTHDMTKAMKSGAGLAVLAAIPGFAEAAQKKDVGKAADVLSDLFVLPFAQSRGLNENERQELDRRLYEGTVGAGRGVAPPSSYQ